MIGAWRSVVRRLLNAWLFRLTQPGRFLLGALALAWTWGATTLSIPVYHFLCGLAMVFAAALTAKLLFRPRLLVSGHLPDTASAGQTVSAAFTVHNASRRPVYDVGVGFFALPRSLREVDGERTLLQVAPAETAALPLKLHPLRRRLYPLPELHVFSTFPFNLWRTAAARANTHSLLVLPSFQPLAGIDLLTGLRYQPGGVALTSDLGESPEYIGNREYQPGDAIRWIDFRSWARLAKPVVRECHEEYYCRIALVLDTFVDPGRKARPEGFPELEATVSLTAAVADALARGEYLIDLFAAGPDLYVFRAGRSIAHFDNILEVLACVDECRASPFETLAPALADELTNITAVVFVLLDWDKSREQFVRLALEQGSSAKVVVVRDGETTAPFDEVEDWAGPVSVFSPADLRDGRGESLGALGG
ncbi:MAG: hypothetical protein COZ06_34550 [Armatimonadetes bacterium CG_4_10_14_3_um_filter_66_18]|nr:DUF58 domain-containing protein [Armatimonadota bacterium]OIP00362.1 MAG: hypothetical protein AUJ96_18555 [Armatimonadetes bacterium CG2_30_66_41]PIY36803.1 MAG: hypothetical protein COZ06_34550 [Armatimonadetes bacterium CG_4_10_14_3_um_filter_66_18]PJB75932.1 MAG: hypothetical protein CO096_01255 [Armatimonadetes bacterium CG_4_9_14_3_um_filter_66_14]NCP34120.1 DUF58 domain-containing protein [Armatimonadota bacterium]